MPKTAVVDNTPIIRITVFLTRSGKTYCLICVQISISAWNPESKITITGEIIITAKKRDTMKFLLLLIS